MKQGPPRMKTGSNFAQIRYPVACPGVTVARQIIAKQIAFRQVAARAGTGRTFLMYQLFAR